jgi:hypothetical protein
MKLVLIDWIDSCCYHGWQGKDGEHDVSSCQTAGFLIEKNKVMVKVAHGWSGSDVDNVMCIPRVCVKKITYLK